MVEVKVGLNGAVTPNSIVLGNRWENNDEKIYFTFPEEFATYNKYLIGVMKQSAGNQTVVLPIQNDTCYISSDLTYLAGKWNLYAMCREQEIDLNDETIDIGAHDNERVFISDVFIGVVNKNMIEKDAVESIALDTNLQILYDELYVLKKEILDQINNDKPLNGSYNDITDKPMINGQELSGNKTLYDFDYVPIHKVDVKSFSALYKSIKTIGLELNPDDISTFFFVLYSNEVEGKFNEQFIELEVMEIYTAEYNPITLEAVVKCSKFMMKLDKGGVLDYIKYNNGGNSGDPALLDSKLDKYQGEENAGDILVVGEDGNVILSNASVIATVNSDELDATLEEVFGNE